MQVGTNTSFILEGKRNNPVLVLANSLAASPSMWDIQVKSWVKNYQVLRFSYPGHGDTVANDKVTTIDLLAAELMALLDQLNIKKFSLVGLSLGAMLGLYVAAKNPGRLQALVAANFRPFQNETTKEQWHQRITAVIEKGIEAIVDGTAERWLSASFRSANMGIDKKIRKMIRETSAEGFMACAQAVKDFDARPFLAEIKCPVLLISGSEDLAAPVAEFVAVKTAIQNSSYLMLEAAHISNIEREKYFTSAVSNFLKLNLSQVDVDSGLLCH